MGEPTHKITVEYWVDAGTWSFAGVQELAGRAAHFGSKELRECFPKIPTVNVAVENLVVANHDPAEEK